MDVIFPTATGYDGFFLIGFRKTARNITERTGTVVLKRTYDVDPVARRLRPSARPLPIFLQDQPDNIVENGGFEDANTPIGWEAETETIALAPGQGVKGTALRVAGPANGRVIQTLAFDEPLGGRRFVLSFSAKAVPVAARVENVQLETDGSDPLCAIDANLTTTMQRFSATGVWPATVQATEMRVVLRAATNAAGTVFYDEIQVEERNHETKWDPRRVLRYEHDLVPFKPQGDVIVLGFASVAGIGRVRVNNAIWFEQPVTLSGGRPKAMLGWEPRVNDDNTGLRQDSAGGFSSNPDDYPLQWPVTDPIRDPLPGGPEDSRTPAFANIFYNGHSRTAARLSAIPYLPERADIHIERVSGGDYRFTLHGEAVSATFFYYDGSGSDLESEWRSAAVAMNLDTLVVEPEKHRSYVVWRGVWPFDAHPEDRYRRLVVEAST